MTICEEFFIDFFNTTLIYGFTTLSKKKTSTHIYCEVFWETESYTEKYR